MDIKNFFYATACLIFCIIIGAAVYEHVAIWPNAFKEPPLSLTMLQGKYGLHSAPFWMMIHPVTLAFFIINLILSWKTERRKNILIALIGYVIILISTFIYFVPTLMSIIETPYTATIDVAMSKKANMWEILSIVRLAALIILAFVLFIGLTKPNHKK